MAERHKVVRCGCKGPLGPMIGSICYLTVLRPYITAIVE